MTSLSVACDGCERPAWAEAAALLNACIGSPDAVAVQFAEAPEAARGDVVVASLLPSLWRLEAPWPETEARWRGVCASWQDAGAVGFLGTIFRHLGPDIDTPAARIRLRRLNLLAAQLSQATGVSVIDLDRVLAHAGGQTLGADARLQSAAARRLAAVAIAGTLLTSGLDDTLTDGQRESALAALAAHRDAAQPAAFGAPTDLQRLDRPGRGQRAQLFLARREALDDRGALGLLRDLRHRRITLAQAAPQLIEKMSRHGRGALRKLLKR